MSFDLPLSERTIIVYYRPLEENAACADHIPRDGNTKDHTMRHSVLGYVFALLATIIWSGNFVASRALATLIPPLAVQLLALGHRDDRACALCPAAFTAGLAGHEKTLALSFRYGPAGRGFRP
ncbi:MAG: hypothetical protein LBB60_06595 [Desulfovibrio sp.]|nr:hypothetical protein [Desulfovibrio sp.]